MPNTSETAWSSEQGDQDTWIQIIVLLNHVHCLVFLSKKVFLVNSFKHRLSPKRHFSPGPNEYVYVHYPHNRFLKRSLKNNNNKPNQQWQQQNTPSLCLKLMDSLRAVPQAELWANWTWPAFYFRGRSMSAYYRIQKAQERHGKGLIFPPPTWAITRWLVRYW